MSTTISVRRYADALAVLSDAAFEVPVSGSVPVSESDGAPGIMWLRAHVSRFANGDVHASRRAWVMRVLDGIDPAALRHVAADRATASLAVGEPADTIARAVPVAVLAEMLGMDADVTEAVRAVARGYHPGTDAGPDADAAVATLVAACGGVADEATAARIAVLVQACDATAGLITNALKWAARREAPTDRLLDETLRFDPPVTAMRRVCVAPASIGTAPVAPGTHVVLDLVAGNRDPAVFGEPEVFEPARDGVDRHLTFGAGRRPCPGREHAMALAAGVVSAVLAAQRVGA